MTLTRSQIHERLTDLSGQHKAALENRRLCADDSAAKDAAADLARQALDKAEAQLAETVAEVRRLSGEYNQRVEELIAVPGAPVAIEGVLEPSRPVTIWMDANFGAATTIVLDDLPVARCGHPPPCDDGGCTHADYGPNGDARITEAFEEAVTPHD